MRVQCNYCRRAYCMSTVLRSDRAQLRRQRRASPASCETLLRWRWRRHRARCRESGARGRAVKSASAQCCNGCRS
eukprot:6128636-Pleurochrysis_carterae.AAC.1